MSISFYLRFIKKTTEEKITKSESFQEQYLEIQAMCYDLRSRFRFLELKKDTSRLFVSSQTSSKVKSQNSLLTERENSSRVGKNLSGIITQKNNYKLC